MLQLLVANPGDAAKFVERRRAHRRDAVDGGVVQHDIGRHAARARDLGTPRLERSIQARIGGFTPAGRGGGPIAAFSFLPPPPPSRPPRPPPRPTPAFALHPPPRRLPSLPFPT